MSGCNNDRVKGLVSDIRRKLALKGIKVTDIPELYRVMTNVQDEMLSELHCKEVIHKIYTKSGKSFYDFYDANILLIKNLFTSWEGEIVESNNWEEDKLQTGSYPTHYKVFAGRFHIPEDQANDGDVIEIWGFQESTMDPIDGDTEPEIPNFLDNTLVKGTCKEFTNEYLDDYSADMRRFKNRIHVKTTKKRNNAGAW